MIVIRRIVYITCTSVNGEGAVLYKVTCPMTTGPGSNWSQLGGNQRKTGMVPGAVEPYTVNTSSHENYSTNDLF